MHSKIKNQLIVNGGVVAAEVPAIREGWRTWFAVHPVSVDLLFNSAFSPSTLHLPEFDLKKVDPSEKFIYTIKRSSADNEYLRNGWDVGNNEFIDLFEVVYSFEDLERALLRFGVDSEFLIEVWNSDYPF